MEVVTIDVCNLLTYVVPNHCVQALPYVCLDFFFHIAFGSIFLQHHIVFDSFCLHLYTYIEIICLTLKISENVRKNGNI